MEHTSAALFFQQDGVAPYEQIETELAWWHQVTKIPSSPHRKKGSTPFVIAAKGYILRKSQTAKEIRALRKQTEKTQ